SLGRIGVALARDRASHEKIRGGRAISDVPFVRTSAYQFEVAVNESRVCVCICDEVAEEAKQASACLHIAAVEHQAVHRFEMAVEIQQTAVVQESDGCR